MNSKASEKKLPITTQRILDDYKLVVSSREASTLGRKEVFMGRAKFGIFGGGKEVAQVALAQFFQNGDFRSGYYRDQTFMFATGEYTIKQLFAQLYANPDLNAEPVSAGRLMTGHFGTQTSYADGEWKNLMEMKNSSTDVSPTASQMPRLVGLGYASKLYRNLKELSSGFEKFTHKGNEVAFGMIGNASTSEGGFFESINAAGVLQIPMLVSVWDDGYGISVPAELQTTKGDISAVLAGFQRKNKKETGFEIFRVNGWDYPALVETYKKAVKVCREEHVPVLVHVTEMTQPDGHSTSGSHERYKSKERLEWELEYDCLKKMREWILEEGVASEKQLQKIEEEARKETKEARDAAWNEYMDDVYADRDSLIKLMDEAALNSKYLDLINSLKKELLAKQYLLRSDIVHAGKHFLRRMMYENNSILPKLREWHEDMRKLNSRRYSSHLYSETKYSARKVEEIPVQYKEDSELVDGRVVLQQNFDKILEKYPEVFAIGEDVGKIGDVNQGFAGLQEKYGELRVTDTGIRENTIAGQAIGAAMRGLRPIAEIQYLDYILYALQILSDDLATIHYRSFGRQKAPVIIRTRGHRLEGVWHSGSPIATLINSIRGIYVCVPRNMTQAAGFYNTMLQSDDSAVIIECLNGYRLKEKLPANLGEYRVPLGQPEILREGTDITIVTYGSMCRVVMEGAKQLEEVGISCEVIDVQTLIPFDVDHMIVESLKKTNRVLFADEDVPGGATAHMMQYVLEVENGYYYLDSKPKTITSWAHRPAYATDGDYFSKPNAEDVFDYVYDIFREVRPDEFPPIY